MVSPTAIEPWRCPRCGSAAAPSAPGGACARCALEQALAGAADDPGASPLFLQDIPLPTRQTPEGARLDSELREMNFPPAAAIAGLSGVLLEKPGDAIGQYRLLEKIGEGGCGVVYAAAQLEPVRRQVALKIVKLGMDTRQVIARFEAERQVLALMDHPHIARVLDAGATATGRPFFVMELVPGIPITRFCNQGGLGTRERLRLFIQVCQAVQHAHQKGIIHRDLKPSNILVNADDGIAVPKVIDFGIAKATGDLQLTDNTVFTAFDQFLGTPAYMSPEQAGGGADVDTRSDIYSLGVLLYELLTGLTPFDARWLAKAGLPELQRVILHEEPPRPSTRLAALTSEEQSAAARQRGTEPPRLIHAIRGDLDWITMKALDKDRNRRYETANGLAVDIRRFLDNEPVAARPPSQIYRLQKMVRRNKLAVASALTVIASLVSGLGFSTWQYLEKSRAEQDQVRLRVRETDLRQQAQTAASEAKMTLSWSDFMQANGLIGAGDGRAALAYLARSLAANPTNDAASIRLATLLTSRSWWVPILIVRHAGRVNTAHFSPDGEHVLLACDDHAAEIWKLDRDQPAKLSFPHPDRVGTAQFSTDGRLVLTAADDHNIRIWDARTGALIRAIPSPSAAVRTAQFNPDASIIAARSDDNVVRLWDATTGALLTPSLQHDGLIRSAQFSPEGRRIVTASADRCVRIWEARTGRLLVGPLMHEDRVWSAQFSPDGKRVVTAAEDHKARIWDAQTGKLLVEFTPGGWVRWAQFSPDGMRVLTCSEDNNARVWDAVAATEMDTARIWDAQTGQPLTPPLKHNDRVWNGTFSPDGRRIVTASFDNTARLWDATDGQPLAEPFKHGGMVVAVEFSPDGKRITTASEDGTARVWEALSGPPPRVALPHEDKIVAAQFSPDGRRVVTAAYDGTARIWDAETGQPATPPLRHSAEVWAAQFSPDGRFVATASFDHTARIWDAQTGQPLTAPLPHNDRVMFVQFSPDSRRLVTVAGDPLPSIHHARDGEIRVWDVATGQPLTASWSDNDPKYTNRFLPGNNGRIYSARFSPDGLRLVTASDNGFARIWEARTGTALSGPLVHGNAVYSAQFSPDGRKIVTASWDHTARIWDAETGRELTAPLRSDTAVNNALFSPDGRFVLTSGNRTARVWEVRTGLPVTEPLAHSDSVTSAQFSPDGRLVVTSSADGLARVWDAQSGQPLTAPFAHDGPVKSAQFSPDGKRIVTASADHTARIWDVAPVAAGYPKWLLELSEAVSGQVVNRQGVLEETRLDRVATINRIRRQLDTAVVVDDWVLWGRWFLADPEHRAGSPFFRTNTIVPNK